LTSYITCGKIVESRFEGGACRPYDLTLSHDKFALSSTFASRELSPKSDILLSNFLLCRTSKALANKERVMSGTYIKIFIADYSTSCALLFPLFYQLKAGFFIFFIYSENGLV